MAVVGRQNVGKSTLVNRLFGRRRMIADARPGVTRDRLEISTSWRGREFVLVDTGGYRRDPRGIDALVLEQAQRAMRGADAILLVVDATTGVVEEDADLARRLRRSSAPVLVVANKVDTEAEESYAAEFHRLGLGEPVAVSALHGRGAGDLLDRVVSLLPERVAELEVEGEPRFAIVGRPNVGKSSLFNRLVGEERSVVFEEAGTTRDAVDAIVRWGDVPVRFVDTAGFRRPSKARGLDYYSFLRTERSIERANVAIVVLDAVDGFTAEDRRIAARVIEEGRGLLLVANKWDLVEERARAFRDLSDAAVPFEGASVMRASALSGSGLRHLPATLLDLVARWSRRVSTSEVNRLLQDVQDVRPPSRGVGPFRYATQVSAGPPTFVVFGAGKPPEASYRRYLENRVRGAFFLGGVPVRLRFRQRRRRAAPRGSPPRAR